jgi:signal transduction histidine kinase
MEQALVDNEGFAAQHGVTLVLHGLAEQVRVCVDSDRLTQVVTNLLSNAIKYSPPQGTVKVVMRKQANRVRVEIIDNGPGIPEEFRKRIFQKFSSSRMNMVSADPRKIKPTQLTSLSWSIIQ